MYKGDRRVMVSGLGAVTPFGVGVDVLWDGMLHGRSGVGPIRAFDTTDIAVKVAGEVPHYDPVQFLEHRVARRSARFVEFALVAAQEAVRSSGLELSAGGDRPEVGVVIGSGYGPEEMIAQAAQRLADKGPRSISPMYAAASGIEAAASEVAMATGASGPNMCLSSACATGAAAITEAYWLIRTGRAEVVITGGAEDCINRLDLAAAARTGAMSTSDRPPATVSRPFDRARDGFVMSAGAGVLVLESAAHLGARGGHAVGQVLGCSSTCDAHHLTAPRPDGAVARRAITTALSVAGLGPQDVAAINAHGTGTALNDSLEVKVLSAVFGDRLSRLPISANKSALGHLIGAAGAVEAILAMVAMDRGVLPPTINCCDPEFPELDFMTDGPRPFGGQVTLSNSFGFGGHNSCLVLGGPDTTDRKATT